MSEIEISEKEIEQIGKCAEQNAPDCDFGLGALCEFCCVWVNKNVPRDCPWVRKDYGRKR